MSRRIVLGALLAGALVPASAALAHGSMSAPISRIYSGFLENPQSPDSAAVQAAIELGGTQPFYDWTEVVNFFPGTPEYQVNVPYWEGIPDGQLASGGNPKYAGIDLVRDDWPTTPIAAGPFEMVWYATTPHDPSVFHAWITTPDWNPTLPLNWAQMTPLTLGPVSLEENEYHFNTILPARTGKHCIYVIWQRLDPVGEGFYSISDVDFGGGSAAECPADFDRSGSVDGGDLAVVLAAWSTPGADLDGNGVTDGADLALVLAAWGACGPDCDGDGISDAAEIAAGAGDCNVDGVPDDCQGLSDCDGDGVLDLCAIVQGLVEDCDMNLVPDSCQIAAGGDANGDGYLDACQLSGLTFEWSVSDQWSTGFIGQITINNNSGEMIHGWQLLFDTPTYTLASVWNGVLISQGNGEALVGNALWNEHVHDGESVSFGFQGAGSPTAPTSVFLNQSPVAPGG